MRLLHLSWSHLPLRLARARWEIADPDGSAFPEGPVVLGGQPWTRGLVLDASEAARSQGVRRGMPLGQAHRLVPEAIFLEPDPDADTAATEAALDVLGRFSPGLAGSTDAQDPGFGMLEVQVDGLERLWGPEPELVRRIGEALAGILPGRPRAGIAGTRFAAGMAAVGPPSDPDPAGSGARTALVAGRIPANGEAAFLAPLPAGALTRDPESRARLERFGLRRIGQVAVLPRSALVARFGPEGDRLHARANGEEVDPFRPRRSPERLVLALPLEPAVANLEAIRFVLHRLAGALADQLLARGLACGRARLRLELDATFARSGTPGSIEVEQRMPEPTAEGEAIERLLLARLEREPPPAPVARLQLELAEAAPAAGQQLALFVPQAARLGRLSWQLARLALGFGLDRVGRVALLDPEASLPERRWCWSSVDPDAGPADRSGRSLDAADAITVGSIRR